MAINVSNTILTTDFKVTNLNKKIKKSKVLKSLVMVYVKVT